MKTFKNNSQYINDTIRSNLQILGSILITNKKIIVSESSSELGQSSKEPNDYDQVKKLYPSVKKLLQNLRNPFKVAGLYSNLISTEVNTQVQPDQILKCTLFDENIHKILTCYLRDQTPFYTMNNNVEKLIDVFYKYMFSEQPALMEYNLKQGGISNLGKWFYQEGIQRMFKKYYFTSQDFTILIANFMLYGLSALFIAAVCALKRQPLQCNNQEIQMIDVAYIKRYQLK